MKSEEATNRQDIVDRIVRFYGLISGNQHDRRNWYEFQELFTENASLTYVRSGYRPHIVSWTVEDYVAALSDTLENRDFWEKGSGFEVTISNHIASVRSTYEAYTDSGFERLFKRGTNFVLLIKVDGQWKIRSMLWEDRPKQT